MRHEPPKACETLNDRLEEWHLIPMGKHLTVPTMTNHLRVLFYQLNLEVSLLVLEVGLKLSI